MPLLFSRAAAAAASAAAATTAAAAAAAAQRCLRANDIKKIGLVERRQGEGQGGEETGGYAAQLRHQIAPRNKRQICELEPRVGLKSSSSPREDEVCGLFVANEHTAVNYISLAEAFVSAAKEAAAGKQLDFSLGTEVLEIKREDKNLFSLITDKGIKKARFVVVSACGHSLLFAQRLGYGREFSCLPVAGSFYFADTMLNGKVYTVQDPRLPFAAVHGDPDILLQGKTRFGPTALPLPLLERNNLKTFFDFAKCVKPDWRLAQVYVQLLNTAYMRAYVFKNFLFEVPKLNLHLFANDLRKIIPSIQVEDLTYAKGFGGIRPQLINKVEKKLLLGEGKIVTGENIIFNITPSPGGTTCLGTAETDMREIARELQARIDEEKFKKILLQGEYPVGN
ncbi:malate:quinone oxidoreductase, putative [Eimeria necatrix]|uniref:Malate:quinone oxidoreductase, putative n=1 Tax=Eimeria necatrix TaxID=51315 RepID=U6MJU2_9EIME|nr:malate:quinone oxidoreductase, putative [Eimeria necatrix]CDJ62719.1 malate:quinone oxidoreductase, putative [Eimeria necatrix]